MSTPLQYCDIQRIMSMLPHRYPFLLLDRVISCEPGKSVHAYKNVTINEPFFQGHFPGLPVMPGVLILEALAQAGGIMVCARTLVEGADADEFRNKLFLLTGIEKVRFRRPVYPGDRLELHCQLTAQKLKLWKMTAHARVDDVVVAQADLAAAITDKEGL